MSAKDILSLISNPTNKEPIKLSNEDIDREMRLVELDIKRENLAGNRQDRTERKNYANKVYWLILGFLVIVLGIVILSGAKVLHLSGEILIVLLTTASANVIGTFVIVMRYLFRQKSEI